MSYRIIYHNIRVTQTMLEAVHTARQGKLHPGLISSKQLEPILRDVEDHLTEVQFPLPGPAVSIEELIPISTVTILCVNRQLKILVDIPLLEKYNYQALKMHPLPTIQEAIGNKTIRAYVKTKHDYLIVDEEQHTYLLLTERDWKSCKSTASYHACLNGIPIYDLNERPACEPSLLINPTIDNLRTCEIQITVNSESFWKSLTTLSSWLYSFSKMEDVVIICHSMTPIKINLNGTGILKLAPGCMARTQDTIIPATISQVGQTEIIYEPDLHLNLTKISPVILNYGHLLTMTKDNNQKEEVADLKFSTFRVNS
ncbi:uncharacterized protein LOC122505895 [Leptopilina heterotoma]|uniref:uncharacterized protein LOC122505895 n=1 Tax=Leptopilina heterotoma TaxID=63436 RepID=UPI001CA856E6|nr:uncharacterized protein LOC122505895 [Leptopilina heterotoma]